MNLKIQNNLCGSFKISFLIPSLLLFKLNLIVYPPFFFFKFEFFTFCLGESSERGTGCQKKIGLKNSLSFQRSGSPLPRHYIYFHLANKRKERSIFKRLKCFTSICLTYEENIDFRFRVQRLLPRYLSKVPRYLPKSNHPNCCLPELLFDCNFKFRILFQVKL